MKIAYIAGFLLSTISLTAEASMWFVFSQQGKSTFLVDTMSIAKRGKFMKAWFRTDYVVSQTMETYPFKHYQSVMDLYYFNCAERTFATGEEIVYSGASGAGDVVGGYSYPVDKLQFSDAAPDSVAEAMLNYVCPHK